MPISCGSHPPVGAADAVEGCRQIEIRRRRDVHAIGNSLFANRHAAILGVNVLARRNRNGGKADDLAVAADRLTGRNRPDRDLVACGNPLDRGHASATTMPAGQARARDQHAVVGMQADDGSWAMVGLLIVDSCFVYSPAAAGRGKRSMCPGFEPAQAVRLAQKRS